MPLIPLKQTITVSKAGGTDGWGQPIPGAVLALKARVTETTAVVTNQAGDEAVASLHILLDKLADVSYDDTITYTNELGVTVARKPLKVGVKRWLSSKAVLTEVFV